MNKPDSLRLALSAIVLIGIGPIVYPILFADKADKLSSVAAKALSRQEWQVALDTAKRVLELEPKNADAFAIAGIACSMQHRDEEAVAYLERGATHISATTRIAVQRELGRKHLQHGQLKDAEACYRNVLMLDSNDADGNQQLAYILAFEGRCFEATPYLLNQLRQGVFLADQLYLLGIPNELSIRNERLKEQCKLSCPSDPLSQLAHARILVEEHNHTAAEPLVRAVIESYPKLSLAQSLLGRILLEQNRIGEAIRWHNALPDEVHDAAEIWFVRGLWSRQTDQPEAAVRCLLETLRTFPNHVEANYQLSQLFQKLDKTEHAKRFSARSLLLSRLGDLINNLRDEPDEQMMQQAVEALEKLGRHWEVVAWCHIANQWGGEDWAPQRLEKHRRSVNRESGQVVASLNPIQNIAPEEYPLPIWTESDIAATPGTGAGVTDVIRFADVAKQVGLDFQYFNSMDPTIGLEHIFQTTGGGIAVLDFDEDLWPDLYFGNGNVLPENMAGIDVPQSIHLDSLYRNRGDGTFSAVTETAAVGDDRFTQGVTAGDFDNDGFQDIYVGNVGQNRLYHNNGDGTFTEAHTSGTTESSVWTMSAMIADVDSDGLSDIYAVNYLRMSEVFDRICKKDGEPLTCAPTWFSAEQDRIYRNLGDGTFEDVTEAYGVSHPNGKGLGIVGLHIEGRTGLQLFIGNDTTENLFYETTGVNGETPFYRENAILAGLAMNESGDMQACMGIAAGDVDLDGNVDLFVTNFFAESNTMYLQVVPGAFTDNTRNGGLGEASYATVGFGTQFLDANLDGNLDVIVTNGHVDQTFATGEPDRMAPQFFLNVSDGRFVKQEAETLGPFFAQKVFGRSLARIDWNRDHKDDACILHLNSPVALLSNRTETSNRAIVLKLKGTAVSRDAIGARVKMQTQDGLYIRQLTGGDGYQASNEKKITLGLPPDARISDFRVCWPDGSETQIDSSHAENSKEILVIQGKGAFTVR